jgi:hypothetical protein
MTKIDNCIQKENHNIFNASNKVVIGNKIYLVNRHFVGPRDYIQAIFAAVENEAKRDDTITQAG